MKHINAMKFIIPRITTAAVALLAATLLAPEAKSADLELKGYGYYDLGASESYFPGGTGQGGRYRNLGDGYYRSAEIEVDAVRNYSYNRSGRMSFELWAMPYYGATSGSVLMTNNLKRLNSRSVHRGVFSFGSAVSLDEPGYAELNLWEYVQKRWRFRDAISFTEEDWF